MNLSKYSLLKEDGDKYQLQGPKGESFSVDKAKLSEKAHGLIKKLKPAGFSDGAYIDEAGYEPPEPAAPEQVALENIGSTPGAGAPVSDPAMAPPAAPAPTADAGLMLPPHVPLEDLDKQKNVIMNAQRVEAAAGNQEAKAYKQASADIQGLQQDYEKVKQAGLTKDAELFKQLQSKTIDPRRLVNNMSTLSRIGMVFASALAGAGAGATHSENPVLQNLNRAIDADIDAQKSDQSKAMNLWKMNREALGNDLQANLATQNQLLTVAKVKAMEAASHVSAAEAQVKLMPLIQQIDMQKAQIQHKQALYSQMQGSGTTGPKDFNPARLVEDFVPKEHQEKVFKEIGRAMDTRKNKAAILQAFDESVKNKDSVTNAVRGENSAYVGAFHQALQPTLKDLDESVAQATVESTHNALTPKYWDTEKDIQNRRAALIKYLDSKSSAPVAEGYQIHLDRFRPTNREAPNFAPGTIIEKGGKRYEVGPDGKTGIPVKG